MKPRQVFFSRLTAVLVVLCSLRCFAQAPEARLTGALTDTNRALLTGSRPPLVRSAQDLGALAPETMVPGITLVFRRSPAQEADLKQLLTALQDKNSPQFHHWFTPETFAARFGMADADIAITEAWLQAHGFRIDAVARSRDRITFSGTALEVQAAFGTELHRYRVGSDLHFAPASDLTLPEALAPLTAAVLHLSDFRPKPSYRVSQDLRRARPDFTALATQAHYLGPKDIATMYDLNTLYQNGYNGESQSLAIVGQSFLPSGLGSSVETFQGNLTQSESYSTILVPGSGVQAISPGDESESEIDLEYSTGIAQNTNVFFVYTGDNQNYSVFDALSFAITQNIAPVVSISYGECELALSASELDQFEALYEQAGLQGQTLVASAGDSGSTACVDYTTAQGITTEQQQALAVAFPASSPMVVAIGGTQMAAGTYTAGSSIYWATATTTDDPSSLLSYVPEVVWNENATLDEIAAGGGGISTYFPMPSWQSGFPGITAGPYRLLPDVALQSSIVSPGYLFCTDDASALAEEGQTASCEDGLLGSNGDYTLAGGTSFAAPIFAGFLDILNQYEKAQGQGDIHPALYNLAGQPSVYSSVFHDITSGTNACSATVVGCSAAGQTEYAATTGYDEATGLGSVDFGLLAAAWPVSTNQTLQSVFIGLQAPSTVDTPGDAIALTISVAPLSTTPSSPIPSGALTLYLDDSLVTTSLPFTTSDSSSASATATYNFAAPAAGSHVLSIGYPGDSVYTPANTIYPFQVGSAQATGSVTLAAANLTIPSNGSGATTVTATPAGGYSGRLFWSLSASGSSSLSGCYSIVSLPVNNVSTTQLAIGVGTACTSSSVRGALRPIGRRAAASLARPVQTSQSESPRGNPTAAGTAAGLLLCGGLFAATRRRRLCLPLLSMLLVVTAAGVGLTGCGGSSGGTTASPAPTPPPVTGTTYTLTLTGTDSVNGAITAATTFTLTVQ